MSLLVAFTLSAALVVFSATPALVAQNPADMQTIANHRLTMESVKKVFAVDRGILKMVTANPELAKKAVDLKPTMRLDEAIKVIAGVPEATALLKAHNISAREYVLTMLGMLSTSMMHDFMGGKSPEGATEIAKANMEFWKTNQAELKPSIDEWRRTRAELMKFVPK